MRSEEDFLGKIQIDEKTYSGISTARAMTNFQSEVGSVPLEIFHAYAEVKLACTRASLSAELFEREKAEAIIQAAHEVINKKFDDQCILPAVQGGAGTSTNMMVNEILARRAEEILGFKVKIDPLNDVNRFQSTNDTYPTAVKIAAIRLLFQLAEELAELQSSLQKKEQEFSDILKIGRTENQDALPVTLGQEFSAFAEAIARDRWRVFKCEERLRSVPLGGTAVGTGINAPKIYIFRAVEELRKITNLGIARAENGVDAIQNCDAFAEVSGILKTCAVNLFKISGDLRRLSSGPNAGIAEISLPPRQAGSSIMPGKINPVIPEFAANCALQVMSNDFAVSTAAMSGELELNAFLPLIATKLIESVKLLRDASSSLRKNCIDKITAHEKNCRKNLENSSALATLLSPYIGYEETAKIVRTAKEKSVSIREAALDSKHFSDEELSLIFSPKNATSPGISASKVLKNRLDLRQ